MRSAAILITILTSLFFDSLSCRYSTAAEPDGAAIVGRWHFDGVDELSAEQVSFVGSPGPPAKVLGVAVADGFVPAANIYDPLTGKSRPNATSLRLDGLARVEIADKAAGSLWQTGRSFTLELFVRPRGVTTAAVARKSRRDSASMQFALQPMRVANLPYYAAWFQTDDASPIRWNTGHELSASRINPTAPAWRHLALVCDAAQQQWTLYVDYYESQSRAMPNTPPLDDGPLVLGQSIDGEGFAGWIDEVRLTSAALGPAQFLRARSDAPTDVRFETAETLWPRASGYVDLKEGFGAVGDGKTDDTAALQRAFAELANRVPLAHNGLYIPPGTYLISDHVRWSRHLVVQGAGRDKTVIRLKDDCPGYGDPDEPKSVVGMGYSEWAKWGKGADNAVGNYLFDLAIDTGRGNPGAVALDHHANDHGAVERVDIRSGDGRGLIGLSFMRPWPGPALIKHVSIIGFDYGVRMTHQEHSITIEHLTLENQNVAGIEVRGNILALRDVKSRNRVPALIVGGANTMVALVDSELTGGAAESAAVRASGALYVRNLKTSGYGTAIEKQVMSAGGRGLPPSSVLETKQITDSHIDEFVGDRITTLHGEATGSLLLPIEDPPEVPPGDIHRDWVNIRKFAETKSTNDWTSALQAAVDSGARTIFFPPGDYPFLGTVKVHGAVERLTSVGRAHLRRAKLQAVPEAPREATIVTPEDDDIPPDRAAPPVLVFDESDAARTLVIERLDVDGIVHDSPATLVVRHGAAVPYRNRAGCGKLFLENVTGDDWRFDYPQQVWARQWHPESHHAGPCIVSRGATLWCLGFMARCESSKLWAFDGAQTEIVGGLVYPVGKIPGDRPIFRNVDSRMAVMYGASIYTSNYKVHIVDEQAGDVQTLGNDRLLWSGSRARVDLFVGLPTADIKTKNGAAITRSPPRRVPPDSR